MVEEMGKDQEEGRREEGQSIILGPKEDIKGMR